MCGIGGILRTDGEPIPDAWLDAIDARIAYRGPDGSGRFRDKVEITDEHGEPKTVAVALLHRRLSIIDHDDGAQPMVSEHGRSADEGLVAVVFNGCIYNHRELRAELEAAGHVFITDHSDTEVLIHGWREWREELAGHLEGMYAFAVWDRTSASLYLARDTFGEKPLLFQYASTPEGMSSDSLAFSSMRAGLACAAECYCHERTPTMIGRFLRTGYEFGEFTGFFEGPRTESLDPGERLSFSSGGPTLYGRSNTTGLFDNIKKHGSRFRGKGRISWGNTRFRMIDKLLEQAVARRLEADVPLGCFLSGGVDSSLIAHFAKKHKPDLRTFSVKMPDARYDESHHAERVAEHLGVDHTTLDCAMNPAEDLVHLIDTLGQPFGDSSILPTYWVSKAAREHVTVALSGDGGDELFIGYERYMAARTLARYSKFLSFLPSNILKRFHPKSKLHKLGRLGEMAQDYPEIGLHAMESIFNQSEIHTLIASADSRIDSEATDYPPEYHMSMRSTRDALEVLRTIDINTYLPGDLLRKVDTASMACALEVRCPFLDRDLASAVLSMPIDQLIPGGKRKGLLRNIARQYLPNDVVDRPKMGFAIPIGEWFRTDFGGMKTLLLDHLNSADPFGPVELNPMAVQRYIDEHMAGTYDHGQKLFTLLTLSIWGRGWAKEPTTTL